jgi:signal transduction histidine kinase/CheY-like chemotaxis protein
MTSADPKRPHVLWFALVALVVMCGGYVLLHRAVPSKSYKVGIGRFPPFAMVSDEGKPSGFVYDLVNEVATRKGIRVEWVPIPNGAPDPFLADGRVDLYPLMAITDEREKTFAMSDPWWENSLGLVSDRETPVNSVEIASRSRIGVMDLTFGSRLVAKEFPGAKIHPTRQFPALIEMLCSREVDAVMIEQRTLNQLWTEGIPSCQGRKLTFHWFPKLNIRYGVGARKGMVNDSHELQQEFMKLAMDGTMTTLGERWGVWIPNQVASVRRSVIIQDRNTWLLAGILIVSFLLGLMIWQNGRTFAARRASEEALQAKSRFLAMISHEIRTPLNGVLGMAELLHETPLNPQQQSHVSTIRSSGEVLLAVINDLLDFSRLEARRLHVEAIPFSPGAAAEEAAMISAGKAEANNLRVLVIVDHKTPGTIIGDPIRTRQILSNLVSNATKFTHNGRVVVRVKPSPDRSRVSFLVEDNGPGIEPEVQNRLFKPFVQADESIARKFGGTGLGLAICQQLCRLLGGEIGVQSELGKGSRFWFDLPASEASGLGRFDSMPKSRIAGVVSDPDLRECLEEILYFSAYDLVWVPELPSSRAEGFVAVLADEAELKDQLPPAGGPPVILLPKVGIITSRAVLDHFSTALSVAIANPSSADAPLNLKLLVAEDNLINQKVIRAMLGRLGCHSDFVENGEEAVRLVRDSAFDGVLMDVNMPGMDGLEATRRIREFNRDLPIVALSAATEFHDDQQAWLLAGMNGFISKPVDLHALRVQLAEIKK